MAWDILDDKQLRQRYLCSWEGEQVLFRQGDTSQDLYVLVAGRLDVLKGEQKIDEISAPGSIFGEMSWLLGRARTATIKAKESSQTLCIPREEIDGFLRHHPEALQQVGQHLAQRLEQTTQVVFGLKELCDHLPDAVIVSDAQGRVMAYNAAAATLYGRDWGQMQGRLVEEVYQDPVAYRRFQEQVMGASSAREEVLTVNHPTRGLRLISTSMTAIMDQERQVQGLISLGRDVTKSERLRRLNRWLLPLLVLLAALGLGGNWLLPYVLPSSAPITQNHKSFQAQLSKDFLLLRTLLKDNFNNIQTPETAAEVRQFLETQPEGQGPYSGVILLDPEKRVLAAFARQDQDAASLPQPGSTYANLPFEGPADSLHKVVALYRPTPQFPNGKRSVELALEVRNQGQTLGWLLLPLDQDYLQKIYGLGEQDLMGLRLPRR